MSLDTIAGAAGKAFGLSTLPDLAVDVVRILDEIYSDLKAVAMAQGMTAQEFDAAADAEVKRIGAWLKRTNDAEDKALRGDG